MKRSTFLKWDFTIQTVIGFICILGTFLLYGLLLLLPFGIWQVVSSLVMVFIYGDNQRKSHLLFTLGWCTGLALVLGLGWENFIFFLVYIIVIPAIVGIWYYRMTMKDYYQTKEEENEG